MGTRRQLGIIDPESWKSGQDPVDHKLYYDCQRARAQAWFRGEEWLITEREYIELWRKDDQYLMKGRQNHCLCMTRQDPELPWTIDNVQIISRKEHLTVCAREGRGKFATGLERKRIRQRLQDARLKL